MLKKQYEDLPSIISCLTLLISFRISNTNSCLRRSKSTATSPLPMRQFDSSPVDPLRFLFPRGESPPPGTDRILLPFTLLFPMVAFLSVASSYKINEYKSV